MGPRAWPGEGDVRAWHWIALLVLPLQAQAECGFTSNITPVATSAAARVDDPQVPAPEIEAVTVARGTGGGAACDGLGFVSVKLKWPRGSDHELDQVGFEYRLVQGSVPEGVVPAGVVAAPVNGRRSEHLFTWQDQEPARQQLIHALLEVRAVTRDGHRGTPAQLVLQQ